MIFKKFITFTAIALALFAPAFSAFAAGNIDSTNKYSQFLNIDLDSSGTNDFINWNPTSGGATVADTSISGYIWGETVGWINLAPTNGGVAVTCGAHPTSDPAYLSGYAWGQNTGWINFSPSATTGTDKAEINPTTGAISGYAWSQNYGYIKLFSTDVGHPGVITTWRGCTGSTPTPPPSGGGSTGGSSGGGCALPFQIINGICQIPTSTPPANPPVTPPANPTMPSNPATPSQPGGNPSPSGGPALPPISQLNPTTLPPTGQAGGGAQTVVSGTNRGPIPIIPVENFAAGLFGGLPKSYAWILPIVGIIGLLSSIPGLVTRIANLILAFIFGRKKQRGIVYDSKTKEPLDPAYVSVFDAATGAQILTQITDIHGRYGFVLKPGMYRMAFNKTHYQFPSAALAGKTKDELYGNLYFGEPFTVTNDKDVVTMNVPMDALAGDWNQQEKMRMNLFKRLVAAPSWFVILTDVLFVIGFIASLVITYYMPIWWNILISILYIIIAIFQALGHGPVTAGTITRNGQPLPYGIVRVYSATLNREVAHAVTSAAGTYYVLVPNGRYYMTIETKNGDETTSVLFTSHIINAKQGIINASFKI